MLIELPSARRRAHLRGFSAALGALVALGATAGALVLTGPPGVLVGIVTGALVGLTGWLLPDRIAPAYRFWNRAVRAAGRRAQGLVLDVCYFTVFAVAGVAGSRAALRRSGPVRWAERPGTPAEAFWSQDELPFDPARPSRWLGEYCRRSAALRRPWMIALVPFLVVIAALDPGAREDNPTAIYTLY